MPDLYIPGRVVHVYAWRGVYRSAVVDRRCAALSDVAVSANMISDHKMRSYFDAIREVCDVAAAAADPPQWQPFHTADSCSCCSAKFTWHCTSSSASTTYREKHNCRQCGLLVCDPCSKHRRVLPDLGLLLPSRVCDRCFFRATALDRAPDGGGGGDAAPSGS